MATIAKANAQLTATANGFSAVFARAGEDAKAFGQTMANVAGGIAAYDIGKSIVTGLVGGVTEVGKYAIQLAADAEQARVSFEVMLGSAEKARDLQAQINKFANATPFESPELIDATKKLLAFNVAQEQIIPTMRTLGDISAGLGIPIGELAELYGKAKVQGRLMAEDVNQLTGRGIPVIQEFARQFGVADSEVKKLVESGAIGFPQLQRAFISLTDEGSRFGGMMEKQSHTVAGLMSNLTGNVNQAMTTIGQSITENLDVRAALSTTADAVNNLTAGMIPVIDSAIEHLGDMGITGSRAGDLIFDGIGIVVKAVATAADYYELILAAYDKLTAATGYWVALAVDGFTEVAKAASWVMEKVGMGGFDTSFIEGFAQGVEENVKRLNDSAGKHWDSFMAGTNAKAIEGTWQEIRRNAEAAKAAGAGVQELAGAADKLKEDATPPAKPGESKEEKKNREIMEHDARQLWANTRTAAEKYRMELEKITALEDGGLIDADTADRARAKAEEDLKRSEGKDKSATAEKSEGPKLLQAGSQEAAQFIASIQRQHDPANDQKAIVKGQATGNKVLTEIRDRLPPPSPPPTVTEFV